MIQSRKVFDPDFKEMVAKDYLETECSLREICAKHDLNLTSVSRWVQIYREHGKEGFLKRGLKGPFVDPKANKLTAKLEELRGIYKPEQENRVQRDKIERLMRIVAEKELRIQILEELLKKTP